MLYLGPFVVTREEYRLCRENAYCQISWLQHSRRWVVGSPDYPRPHQMSGLSYREMTMAYTSRFIQLPSKCHPGNVVRWYRVDTGVIRLNPNNTLSPNQYGYRTEYLTDSEIFGKLLEASPKDSLVPQLQYYRPVNDAACQYHL